MAPAHRAPGKIVPVPRGGPLPLSIEQERQWFVEQRGHGAASAHNWLNLSIEGDLDRDALNKAFALLVSRHEALRTRVVVTDNRPMQVIDRPYQPHIVRVDAFDDDEARRLRVDLMAEPFDIQARPMMRQKLLRRSERVHELVWTFHHLISDGVSHDILRRELGIAYRAFRRNEKPSFEPLALQPADHAVWERRCLEEGGFEEQFRYWTEQLSGFERLQLPLEPVPHTGADRTDRYVLIPGDEGLLHRVDRLAQELRTTRFALVSAAAAVLLARTTGQTDLCLGAPTRGRTRQLLDVVGFFSKVIPLRFAIDWRTSFRQLVQQVASTVLQAVLKPNVPYEDLANRLKLPRAAAHETFFPVLMWQWTEAPQVELEGLSVRPLPLDFWSALGSELVFHVRHRGHLGEIVFRPDLLPLSTVERWARQLSHLLAQAVEHLDAPLGSLELTTPDERRQLAELNATSADFGPARPMHQLFEASVARTPDATAVVAEDGELTYSQLNARANQLAHQLVRMGVGPEVPVGMCLTPSLDMVVALLGILKAGGAYVPLDAKYPRARLAYMFEDSGAKVLVTRSSLADRFDVRGPQLLLLDRAEAALAREDTRNLDRPVPNEALAYVIYTSGTTGTPKGVGVTHRSLVNYVQAAQRLYAMTPSDRVLQFASISWDTSAEEIYPTLACGARLALRTERMLQPRELLRQCAEWGITVLNLPTAYWHELVAELTEPPEASALRLLIVGGERGSPERAKQWKAMTGSEVRLVNTYGTTEATAVTTSWEVQPDQHPHTAALVVGRPLHNIAAYVCDESMRLMPVGVPGELYIGGAGLARGYLRRPDATAEKFVPDVFSGQSGARLYRTGDRARYLPNGDLEHLGRSDGQLKIRGYRIEPEEIGRVLLQHPAVKDAVVVADRAGEAVKLVAYVVPRGGEPLASAALRQFASDRLPEHMVPAAFVSLEKVPLTPNGKLDRRALPQPSWAADLALDEPPSGKTEEVLAAIWQDVLGVPKVGRRANFFELGGHSLLAIRMAHQASKAGLALGAGLVLRHPTLEQLAEAVDAAAASARGWDDASQLVVKAAGDRPQAEVPLSYLEERFLSVWKASLRDGSRYQSIFDLMLEGPLDVAALERAFNAVVRRHDVLWSIYGSGEAPTKRIAPVRDVALPVVDLSSSSQQAIRERLVADACRDFTFDDCPLIRGWLYRFGPERHGLLLTLAHIVSDATSVGIFTNELLSEYQACRGGAQSMLPRAPVQYSDFARWQREWHKGAVVEGAKGYWTRRLRGAGPLNRQLRVDHPRAPLDRIREGQYLALRPSHGVECTPWQPFPERLRRELGTRMFDLFTVHLAAFATAMARMGRTTDLVVSVANDVRRRVPGLEGVVGFFTNTVLLRVDLSGELTYGQMLERVREEAKEVYAMPDFQLVPFVYPRLNDMMRVLFNFFHVPPVGGLVWPGLKSSRLLGPLAGPLPDRKLHLDLLFVVNGSDEQFRSAAEYLPELWTEETIRALGREYQATLWKIADEPMAQVALPGRGEPIDLSISDDQQ
jgi:amino acid adenylation domain-containing protein